MLFADLVDKLLRAVSAKFPDDRTRPGVVLSYLGPGPVRFYGSVVRYDDAGEKIVIHQARSVDSFVDVLLQLSRIVARKDTETALSDLRDLLEEIES